MPRTPVLYVVPIAEGQPDSAARWVVSAFVDAGFQVVTHHGAVDDAAVYAGAAGARATVIVLCLGEQQSVESFRSLVVRVRDSDAHRGGVVDVLVVRAPPEETLEGDRGMPFFVHPSEGEDRVRWLAEFVASSAGFRPGTGRAD